MVNLELITNSLTTQHSKNSTLGLTAVKSIRRFHKFEFDSDKSVVRAYVSSLTPLSRKTVREFKINEFEVFFLVTSVLTSSLIAQIRKPAQRDTLKAPKRGKKNANKNTATTTTGAAPPTTTRKSKTDASINGEESAQLKEDFELAKQLQGGYDSEAEALAAQEKIEEQRKVRTIANTPSLF